MKCTICNSTSVREYFEVKNSPCLQNVLYESVECDRSAIVVSAKF